MLGDPAKELGAPVSERGGELLQRVEAELGATISQRVAEIYDTVMEEITVLRPTVRGLEYELKEKNASGPGGKEAGVMSLLVKFRDWLVRGYDKMKRLFGMGTRRIDNAGDKIENALKSAESAYDKVLKTAGEVPDAEVPDAFKEQQEKMKAKSKDKDEDEESGKKATYNGYSLTA
jgi:hypothetical protein